MIEPILQCLHVAEEHRAGAATAELMPRAMGLEILAAVSLPFAMASRTSCRKISAPRR